MLEDNNCGKMILRPKLQNLIFRKKIDSYNKQDKKAGRGIKEDEVLTIEQVTYLLENPVCHRCHRFLGTIGV